MTDVFEQFIVSKSNDSIPSAFQPCCTLCIRSLLSGQLVVAPIYFNNQFVLQTKEINYIFTYNMLSLEGHS